MFEDIRSKLYAEANAQLTVKRQLLLKKLQEVTPVDTGHARDSWRLDGNKVVNDVEYIKALNLGSSKQAPAHFIEQTMLETVGPGQVEYK